MTDLNAPAPRQGPLVLGDDDPALSAPAPNVDDAPPLPDAGATAMGRAAAMAAGQGDRAASGRRWIGRLFWTALVGIVSLGVALWFNDFVTGLFARSPLLGWIGAGLAAAMALALLALAVGELAGLSRLRRTDAVQRMAMTALADGDRAAAVKALDRMSALWAGRPDAAWGLERLAERTPELLDAEALLHEAEHLCLAPMDADARRIVTDSARQVAAATAFVPIPLADMAAALWLNLRMIRRVAEIYGGRAGMLGSWRLFKAVAAHLAATGAVAVGDDFLGPVLGGGALAKLSRRFGEGLVNGALTARVGAAAIEVCRPLPFEALERPKARKLVAAALGQWGKPEAAAAGPR